MDTERTHRRLRAGVSLSALCLAAFGAMLLFAPEEVSTVLVRSAGAGPFVQLLGAAFLGFGVMNWIARGAVLGGIYGKAVVAGNQTHLTIGALLLVARGIDVAANHPAYWVLTGFYVLGAGLFGYLTFFASGIPASR